MIRHIVYTCKIVHGHNISSWGVRAMRVQFVCHQKQINSSNLWIVIGYCFSFSVSFRYGCKDFNQWQQTLSNDSVLCFIWLTCLCMPSTTTTTIALALALVDVVLLCSLQIMHVNYKVYIEQKQWRACWLKKSREQIYQWTCVIP